MAKLLMYSYGSGVMERLQSVSLSGYCASTKANQERLSPISSEAMELVIENLSQKRVTTHHSTPTIDVSYRTSLLG
jgi:hypothetical protein